MKKEELDLMKLTARGLSIEELIKAIGKNPILYNNYYYSFYSDKQKEEIKRDLLSIFDKLIEIMIKNNKFLIEYISKEKPNLKEILLARLSKSDVDFIFKILDNI